VPCVESRNLLGNTAREQDCGGRQGKRSHAAPPPHAKVSDSTFDVQLSQVKRP
jgi:hypothetical protein